MSKWSKSLVLDYRNWNLSKIRWKLRGAVNLTKFLWAGILRGGGFFWGGGVMASKTAPQKSPIRMPLKGHFLKNIPRNTPIVSIILGTFNLMNANSFPPSPIQFHKVQLSIKALETKRAPALKKTLFPQSCQN